MSEWLPVGDRPLETATFDPMLREEVEAVYWIFEEVRAGRPLPVVEAEAVAHSLHVSMQLGTESLPQIPLRDMNHYNAVHGINVALIAMAAAGRMNLDGRAVREIGIAGLLHDIGMVRVPVELLAKAEQLTEQERGIITRHPINGASIIIESGGALDLAAVVAHEHHIKPDGGGYPTLTYPRPPHRVARLIAVCDTFHALSSPRPFREAWPDEIIYSFLQQRAGFDFDSEMVDIVTKLMRDMAQADQGS